MLHAVMEFAVRWMAAARLRAGSWLLALPMLAPAAWADEPLWVDAGRPTPLALSALALLADAPSHGLDARDYGLPSLQRASQAQPLAPDALAPLSAAMRRYLQDLHDGRVPPPAAPASARASATRDPLRRRRRTARRRGAGRPVAGGARGRATAAPVRAAARGAGAPPRAGRPPGLAPAAAGAAAAGARVRSLAPGQPWAGLAAARGAAGWRWATWLRPTAATARHRGGAVYDGALVAAVQAFQRRHGLADDGVIGRATLAALQVPPAQRVQQLQLALERLRWTPLLQAPRRSSSTCRSSCCAPTRCRATASRCARR
jgi:hypothetical protein